MSFANLSTLMFALFDKTGVQSEKVLLNDMYSLLFPDLYTMRDLW